MPLSSFFFLFHSFFFSHHLFWNSISFTEFNAKEIQNDGSSYILVAVDNSLAAVITLEDPIKPEAQEAIHLLKSMNIECWMLTGDNRTTALAVAKKVGLTDVLAEVKPAEKAAKVSELQSRGLVVAMVGDGVNDSPALAQADVGIAIGAGTDIALESAQIVLIKNNLLDVITAIDLSKKTFKRIKLNYLWAMIYNVLSTIHSFLPHLRLFLSLLSLLSLPLPSLLIVPIHLPGIPLAAGLLYPYYHIQVPPLVASACMAFSSISVVLSSLELKRYRPPHLRPGPSHFLLFFFISFSLFSPLSLFLCAYSISLSFPFH